MGPTNVTIDAIHPSKEEAVSRSRRSLLLLAGGSLLSGMAWAADEAPADAQATASASGTPPVLLDPIALAILHHAGKGATSWSSRTKLRAYVKSSGSSGVLGLNAAAANAAALSDESRAILATWQTLMVATNVFQRSREFQKLVGQVDAYATRVLNADRYHLPLNGQGFVSYDEFDQELINDAGMVDAGTRVATTRFPTLDSGATGALQVMNLHIQQLNPSLKAPAELYRVAVPDTDLAERLLKGKAGTVQMLELQLRGDTPRCFPSPEAMKGTPHPIPALAVQFFVVDAASGEKLFSKPIETRLRQGKKGYCYVG